MKRGHEWHLTAFSNQRLQETSLHVYAALRSEPLNLVAVKRLVAKIDRYYRAAREHCADPVVRVTGDCPVIDPAIVDEVIEGFSRGGYDVFGLAGEFPDGLDSQFLIKDLDPLGP